MRARSLKCRRVNVSQPRLHPTVPGRSGQAEARTSFAMWQTSSHSGQFSPRELSFCMSGFRDTRVDRG